MIIHTWTFLGVVPIQKDYGKTAWCWAWCSAGWHCWASDLGVLEDFWIWVEGETSFLGLTDHLFPRKPNSLKVRKSKFWTAVISSWSWTRARTIKGTYSILLHFLPTVNILQDVVSISCHRRWGKTSDIWLTNNYISIIWSFIFYMAFTKYIKQLGRNKDNKNVWK